MKANTLIAMILLTFVLVACAPSTSYGPQPAGVAKQTGAPAPSNTGASISDVVNAVQADTESKNVKTDELFIPIVTKSASAGDLVVFGSILNPLNLQTAKTYFARISYVEGRDKNSNKIEVDADTIKSWIRTTQTDDFTFSPDKPVFIPLIFNVGKEIKPGVPTVMGTYRFEVQFYDASSGIPDKIDKLQKDVFIRVG